MIPEGIVTTGWPAVEAQCREWGDEFDEWQRGLGRVMLGKREGGEYAATVGGVTLSIPRQVAKTFLVGRTVFALCAQFPGLKVLWTAHRARTATNTFRGLEAFAKRKAVAPYIAPGRRDGTAIRAANGEQEVPFRNGSIIMFGARETGFGRGFDVVDVEVFDEAQILTERALDDMIAATNQSLHPHGALLFFMGTPPRPIDPGEAFTLRRAEALAGEMVDGVYVECSADPDADPDDRTQWAKANPSYPARTPERSMLRLRKNLASDESFLREACGVWDEQAAEKSEIDLKVWAKRTRRTREGEPRPSPVAISIQVQEDRKRTMIGLAGRMADGARYLDVIRWDEGSDWVVDAVGDLVAKWRPVAIALDPAGPTGALVADLKQARRDPRLMTARELGQATAMLIVGVKEGSVAHRDNGWLTNSIRDARTRKSGESTVWDSNSPGDIAPTKAVSIALWALGNAPTSERSGVVYL